MVTSYHRGHLIYYNDLTSTWNYSDDNSICTKYDKKGNSIITERPCKKCGKEPTKEGYDNCLGYLDGVVSACCGHGVEKPYILRR